jgi:hypothetical protein
MELQSAAKHVAEVAWNSPFAVVPRTLKSRLDDHLSTGAIMRNHAGNLDTHRQRTAFIGLVDAILSEEGISPALQTARIEAAVEQCEGVHEIALGCNPDANVIFSALRNQIDHVLGADTSE